MTTNETNIQEAAQKHFARLEEKYMQRIAELEDALKAARADTLDLQTQLAHLRDNQTGQATLRRSTGLNSPTQQDLRPYVKAKLAVTSLQQVAQEVADAQGVTLDEYVQRGF